MEEVPQEQQKVSDRKIYVFVAGLILTLFLLYIVGSFLLLSFISNKLGVNRKDLFNDLDYEETESVYDEVDEPLFEDESIFENNNEDEEVTPVVPENPAPPIIQQEVPKEIEPPCVKYKIYEGEFKSDKCYSSEDYQDLRYYLQQYNSAVFEYDAAENQMDVTCKGFSESFKELCEESKERKEDAEDDIEKYEDKIKEIISKGK